MNDTLHSPTTPPPPETRKHGWIPRNRDGLLYRLGVLSRTVAAIGGGYGVAALTATVIALYLPAARADAAITGTLVAFVVYAGAAMWVFAARTALRAWVGLLVPAALLGTVLAVHYFARSAS
jgi:hypothetical protein